MRNRFHTRCGAHSLYSDSFTRIKRSGFDVSQWSSSSQRQVLDLHIKAEAGSGL